MISNMWVVLYKGKEDIHMSNEQLTLEPISAVGEARACTRCKGEKKNFRAGFTYTDSYTGKTTVYEDKWEECNGCKGEGYFSAPDYDAILALMTTGKGDKYRMRSTMTSTKAFQSNDRNVRRATYVHRLACFAGRRKAGDQCMPVLADIALGCDPWKPELNAFADVCAKRFFGTDMR